MNWYVDPAAIGTGTGLDWANAYTSIAYITTANGAVAHDKIYCRGKETLTVTITLETIPWIFIGCNASGVFDGVTGFTIDHANSNYDFDWKSYKTVIGMHHINFNGVTTSDVLATTSTFVWCSFTDGNNLRATASVISHCTFDTFSYYGITGANNRIGRCVFKDCVYAGIYTSNGYNTITNSVFINCPDGIYSPNYNSLIEHNVFYKCTNAIKSGGASMLVAYNRFIECTLGILTSYGAVTLENNGFFECTTNTGVTGTGSFIDIGGGVTELTTNGVVDAENYDFTTVSGSELTMIETDIGGDVAPSTTDYLSCGLTPECSGGSGSGARSRFGEILGIKRGIY